LDQNVQCPLTDRKTLVASLTGGTPATTAGPTAGAGNTSGHERCLLHAKSAGYTGPTSVRNKYKVVKYSGIHKNDIYKKKLKF
jgi:hypothetical protein